MANRRLSPTRVPSDPTCSAGSGASQGSEAATERRPASPEVTTRHAGVRNAASFSGMRTVRQRMWGRIVSGGGFETRLDGPIENRPQVENLPHSLRQAQIREN